MKVKTCSSCVYTPADLAPNYDPHADLFCCGRCPNQGLLDTAKGSYPREWIKHPERTLYYKRHQGGVHEPKVAGTLPA